MQQYFYGLLTSMRLRGLSKGMLSGFSCFSSSSCLGRVSWWSRNLSCSTISTPTHTGQQEEAREMQVRIETMSPAWAQKLNVLITRPKKLSINSHYSVYKRLKYIKASIICSSFCLCTNTKNARTWLTIELSAVHGFRHVWCESCEFAEGQQGFLLAEVPSFHVGLTVEGTMGLSWRETKHL